MICNKCVLFSLFLDEPSLPIPPLNTTANKFKSVKNKTSNEEIVVNPFNRIGYGFDVFILFCSKKRLSWSKTL